MRYLKGFSGIVDALAYSPEANKSFNEQTRINTGFRAYSLARASNFSFANIALVPIASNHEQR
jgi:hypothetical protein